MGELIPDRLRELLSGPCSMVLAAAHPSGPVAVRTGGARIEAGDRVRVLLAGNDARSIVEAARAATTVAIASADIADYTSFQVKGVIESVAAADEEDHAHMRRFILDLISLSERLYGFERARNYLTRVQAAVTVRVDEVFRQSPGVGAGELLFSREARPSKSAHIDAIELPEGGAPPRTLQDIESALDGIIPPCLVTIGPGQTPNVSYLSKLEVVDEHTLCASRQFFKKTAQNLARDPRALALVMDVSSNRSYGIGLTHLRTETSGALFEQMRARIDAIASLTGMRDVFRLVGVDVFHVERIHEMLGIVSADG